MRTLINGFLLHDSDKTIIAIKSVIVRRRRNREISAERARDAMFDIEMLDYQDLECQVAYLMCNKDVFGTDYHTVIRGCVLTRAFGKPAMRFRDALHAFVAETRSQNGCLYGEPFPVYALNGVADFLQRRGV